MATTKALNPPSAVATRARIVRLHEHDKSLTTRQISERLGLALCSVSRHLKLHRAQKVKQ